MSIWRLTLFSEHSQYPLADSWYTEGSLVGYLRLLKSIFSARCGGQLRLHLFIFLLPYHVPLPPSSAPKLFILRKCPKQCKQGLPFRRRKLGSSLQSSFSIRCFPFYKRWFLSYFCLFFFNIFYLLGWLSPFFLVGELKLFSSLETWFLMYFTYRKLKNWKQGFKKKSISYFEKRYFLVGSNFDVITIPWSSY